MSVEEECNCDQAIALRARIAELEAARPWESHWQAEYESMKAERDEAHEERDRLAAALEEAERRALVSIHGMDACDFCGMPQRGERTTHEDDCPFRALANGKDGDV